MKLTKEEIYIDLRGKSKDELNLITEITGVENLKNYYYLHFYTPLNKWIRYHVWTDNIENKQEVTIEQLKEILQPMGTFKKGDTIIITDFGTAIPDGVFSLNRPYKLRKDITEGLKVEKDNNGFENGYSVETTLTMKIELYSNTLQQQLQKAEAEVKRLKDLINAKDELKRIQKLIESLENESRIIKE